ncbi:protein EFR3 homolog B isoform X2 [Catharus ustulatus]|uniref:protein EFR3 homolog B isoform X2 n=1 Tax=Catharus ustulatus TaxID=91951 RepID=UPI00140D9B9D|nr:protein EFR3 homolog B isoform X2 [Catharus ustulatus]
MYGVCGCCGALRPRYKRLVDNIFPEDPEDGLVKTNMEKLTFYALSAPEKLDRIGAYLSERLIRDVGRHRYGSVCIAMEALDQLLMACHCQSINLFVESFLKMVAKLLESEKPNLQILGTNSFVKFANIEEDTPSYHRSYDFFVSRFSEMCHSSHADPDVRARIRMSGIKGLQGVVRKTVNDELQANIWEPQHMDKIVPSLLFNLQQAGNPQSRSPSPLQASEKEQENPWDLAERCLRELLGRAAYGNIKNAIKPVLIHLDNHSLWEPQVFARSCFRIIMFSIQPQHSHLVIQQLLGHLDANSRSAAPIRAGIVEVLSEAAGIAASGSVGPTVLEVFNTLLRQLRLSIDLALSACEPPATDGHTAATDRRPAATSAAQERGFQEAVIRTIGSFSGTLPPYQQSEVMIFIMNKVPIPENSQNSRNSLEPPAGPDGENRNRLTQIMLLKSLLQVSVGFQCSSMLTALPSAFLERLLSAALLQDPEIRIFVLEILCSFIDRRGNRHKLCPESSVGDVSALKLKVEKCSRQDSVFMKKHGSQLLRVLFLLAQQGNNSRDHFRALFRLLALLALELATDDVITDLVRLALALQALAQEDPSLPGRSRCALLALSAAFLHLLGQLLGIPALLQHTQEVIQARQKEAPFLLPQEAFGDNPESCPSLEQLGPEFFLWQSKISEILGSSGYSAERISAPYEPQSSDEERLSKRKSIGETISLQVEVESRNSPEREQRAPAEEITYETLKKAIVDSVAVEEQERERRRQVVERFQTAPFEEIAAHCGARAMLLQSKLNQIFEITIRPPPSPSGAVPLALGPAQPQSQSQSQSQSQPQPHSIPVYEMKFPDLCVY